MDSQLPAPVSQVSYGTGSNIRVSHIIHTHTPHDSLSVSLNSYSASIKFIFFLVSDFQKNFAGFEDSQLPVSQVPYGTESCTSHMMTRRLFFKNSHSTTKTQPPIWRKFKDNKLYYYYNKYCRYSPKASPSMFSSLVCCPVCVLHPKILNGHFLHTRSPSHDACTTTTNTADTRQKPALPCSSLVCLSCLCPPSKKFEWTFFCTHSYSPSDHDASLDEPDESENESRSKETQSSF
jgi:hypothetical protein